MTSNASSARPPKRSGWARGSTTWRNSTTEPGQPWEMIRGIGVDLEERIPGRDLDGIGGKVYGPTEQEALAAATGSQKVHLFFRLWSMKEALIKALGTGFSLNPSRFEVPGPMLHGVRSGDFRFPHAPSSIWRLVDLGEPRFAAALACRLSSCRSP